MDYTDYKDLIGDYLDDAGGHLNNFDSALLSLEKNGTNRELIQDVLGSLHTLKGNSGMMGFDAIKRYIHKIEELLKKVLDNEIDLSRVINALFESANVIRGALQEIEKERAFNSDLTGNILNIEKFLDGNHTGPEKQEVELTSYLGTKTDTIKVDFKRLDDLLNLVGELVIFKTRLNQMGEKIKAEVATKALGNELNGSLELMGKTISGLQEGIMKARMLPVRHVFNKFPRMVRDLSHSMGKEVRLLFEGEDTEIDKTVIDALDEPLLHMIRNAIDHGIESPSERTAKGKNREGRIALSAYQESNHVVITVRDDGRGIDLEHVRELGVKRGLLAPEAPLNEEGVLSLIFSSGFTTKQEATDISGRGVGLDVVGKNIAKLNGFIDVYSRPNEGTAFTIKLPLSLAIIPALMVEAEGEVYAIPMSAVDESLKARSEDIHIINNHEVIRFRKMILPVVRLNDFLGFRKKRQKKFYLVVVGKAEKRLAVAVDRLRGQQDIVIKPLDDTLGKSYGIAGASILGDGRIVLIVDVMSIYKKREVSGNG
ncbi:MAG TPA: chemotaxis protein CheA [Thermodesulfovibrionales bacterium]|nr:chemotaxis protein CheA [Thermodesulfovibrionales bacterium]